MVPLNAALGVLALAGAFAGGAWMGYDYRDARVGRAEAETLRDASKQLEHAMVAREAARAAVAAVGARTEAALQRAIHATQKPIPCPPSGDVRDAVLPGLADRVRDIRAAGADAVDPVPAAASAAGQ